MSYLIASLAVAETEKTNNQIESDEALQLYAFKPLVLKANKFILSYHFTPVKFPYLDLTEVNWVGYVNERRRKLFIIQDSLGQTYYFRMLDRIGKQDLLVHNYQDGKLELFSAVTGQLQMTLSIPSKKL